MTTKMLQYHFRALRDLIVQTREAARCSMGFNQVRESWETKTNSSQMLQPCECYKC